MGHTAPFGFIWPVLMHIEVLGWVGKISFWKETLLRKKSSAIGVWFVCWLVGWLSCLFFCWVFFDPAFSFSGSILGRSEALHTSYFCKVALLCLLFPCCCYELCVLAGFWGLSLFSSSMRTGSKVQGSFGLSAFWHTARGTPSWGKMTLILDRFVHYFGF